MKRNQPLQHNPSQKVRYSRKIKPTPGQDREPTTVLFAQRTKEGELVKRLKAAEAHLGQVGFYKIRIVEEGG